MDPQFISDNEKNIIGSYPNTYTFSKSMAERTLKKNHGNLPVSIVRPSIIISSYEQPTPGWTDTLAAGGGITYACSSGLMHYVFAAGTAVVDFIPVDFTTNTILAVTVYCANYANPKFVVYHSSTSDLNPILISTFRETLAKHS